MAHQNASDGPRAAEAPEIRLQQFSERFTGLPQDDWSGMGDVKQRKKVQNRLNQRALRKSLSTPWTLQPAPYSLLGKASVADRSASRPAEKTGKIL